MWTLAEGLFGVYCGSSYRFVVFGRLKKKTCITLFEKIWICWRSYNSSGMHTTNQPTKTMLLEEEEETRQEIHFPTQFFMAWLVLLSSPWFSSFFPWTEQKEMTWHGHPCRIYIYSHSYAYIYLVYFILSQFLFGQSNNSLFSTGRRQVGVVEPHKKLGNPFHFMDSGWINHPPGFYYVFKREISAPLPFSSSSTGFSSLFFFIPWRNKKNGRANRLRLVGI